MSRRFAPASLALLLALALVGCEGNKRHADTPLPTAQTAGGASFAQRTPHVIPALAPTATPRGSAAPPSQASSPSPTSAGGAWRAVGQMIVPREGHTATLLPSGKVLIAGGRSRHSLYLAAAELYDPATDARRQLQLTMGDN